MMYKKGRFTRLLACFLAFLLILSEPVVSLAESEVANVQEAPAASEQFEAETENLPVIELAQEACPSLKILFLLLLSQLLRKSEKV